MTKPTYIAALAPELAKRLSSLNFTTDAIREHLGPELTRALHRGEPAAVRWGASGDSDLDLLIRLFLIRDPAPASDFARVLGPDLAEALLSAAINPDEPLGDDNQVCGRCVDNEFRVLLDIRPHIINGHERLIFSDADAAMVPGHIPGPDHVLGVGAASLSLLRSTPSSPVASVLDLGTGSGVQALGQWDNTPQITATDIHPRALALAKATFAATSSSPNLEILPGPWFEPVQGRTFERILANPPFVVGLPEVGHIYRDSGLNLDEASRLVVSQAPEYLCVGGTAHLLAAWIHTDDQSWRQRVASWIPDHGVDAWILQRDIADPAHYVGTWLRDESLDPRTGESDVRTQSWLNHFHNSGVRGIGFGYVALRRLPDNEPSRVLAEELPQTFTDELGPEIEEYFLRSQWLSTHDPLDATYQLRPGLALEEIFMANAPSAEFDPEHMGFKETLLRITRTEGPRFSHEIDYPLKDILSALHPQGLPLRDIVSMYCLTHEADEEALADQVRAAATDLLRHGMIIPAELLEG